MSKVRGAAIGDLSGGVPGTAAAWSRSRRELIVLPL
jgi:hypothetical protein